MLNETREKDDDGSTNQFLDEKNLYSKQYASIFLMQMSIIKIIKGFCKFLLEIPEIIQEKMTN